MLILWGLHEWSTTQQRVYYDSCTSGPSALRVTPSLIWVAMTYARLAPTYQRVIKTLLRMIKALYEFHTIKELGNAKLLALSKNKDEYADTVRRNSTPFIKCILRQWINEMKMKLVYVSLFNEIVITLLIIYVFMKRCF